MVAYLIVAYVISYIGSCDKYINTGCIACNKMVNHLMYTDIYDLVVLSP